jgi:hypothetical protein
MDNLLPTETSFHGIVPGKPTYPLGVIHLDIIFGTPANFRKEKIEFEVVDWPSQYHAICRWISCRKNTGYHATDPKI